MIQYLKIHQSNSLQYGQKKGINPTGEPQTIKSQHLFLIKTKTRLIASWVKNISWLNMEAIRRVIIIFMVNTKIRKAHPYLFYYSIVYWTLFSFFYQIGLQIKKTNRIDITFKRKWINFKKLIVAYSIILSSLVKNQFCPTDRQTLK